MKRYKSIYVALLLMIVLCISGCGQYKATSDMRLNDIEIGMTRSELESLDLDLVESNKDSKDKDNTKYWNMLTGITVMIKNGKVDTITASKITGRTDENELAKFKTKLGIGFSDSKQALINAYGEPDEKYTDDKKIIYRYRIKKKDGEYGYIAFEMDKKTEHIRVIKLRPDDMIGKNIAYRNKLKNNNQDSNTNTSSTNNETTINKSYDSLSLGGVSLINTDSEITSILGAPLESKTNSDGVTVRKYKDVEVHIANGQVQMIVSNSPDAKTSRGIHEQSSLFDAVKEYGGAYETSDYGNYHLVEYKVDDSNIGKCIIRFAAEKNNNDKVSYISIRRAG